MPNSYMVGVKTKTHNKEFAYNALRFDTKFYAECYAASLKVRWREVTTVFVAGSDDQANAIFPVPSDRYPVARHGASQ